MKRAMDWPGSGSRAMRGLRKQMRESGSLPRRLRAAMCVLAGLGLLAGTLFGVPGSSWASRYDPFNNSTDCNAELVGENPFWTGILEQMRRQTINSLSTQAPGFVNGTDAGETIDLSWTIDSIPRGWLTEICVEKSAFVLNKSEEVCSDIASGDSATSANVSQCIGSSCSYRDIWRIRVRLGTNCNGMHTQWSEQISVQVTEDN